MFDIAINGMAVVGGDTFTFSQVDYSHFVPFNKAEYFHPYCQMDYSNATSDDVVRHPPPSPASSVLRGLMTVLVRG